MTYDTLKASLGRDHVTVVEMDLDFCSLTYGTSPCTAAVGTTGSTKCYNTFKTCQDTANYDKTSKTYRFISQNSKAPVGVNIFPCLSSVNHIPTRIDVNSLSIRGTVKIKMFDFTHHDRGIDPYVGDRNFDPSERGTFWSKFKARNPYVIGRPLRVKYGYVNPAGFDTTFSTDFETRNYIIDKIDYNSDGTVTITGKDVLDLTQKRKAKAPVESTGSLDGAITDSATTITLDDASDYATSGIVRISDELITYTGKSGNDLTGCTRGTNNTTAQSHSDGDEVQQCLQYSSETIQDIVYDLLNVYAGINASFLPKTDWDAETPFDPYVLSTIITEPTGVQELLDELTEQSNSNIWWDDREQEVKFKPISVPLASDIVKTIAPKDLISDSVSVDEDRQNRVSRVTVYYGIQDYTKDLDETTNYLRKAIQIDTDSEGENQYNQEAAKVIYSRWIDSDSITSDLTNRILLRLAEVPKRIKFKVDAKDSDLATGDIIYLSTRQIQDFTGLNDTRLYVIVEEMKVGAGNISEYEAVEFNTGVTNNVAFLIADNSQVDYLSASASEQATYAFISNNSGQMSNGDSGYNIA